MRLVRLDIHMLPGIRPGFTLEAVAPGSNIITGPNAAGKSSLVRALGYLIGGVRADDPGALSLAASFESNGAQWTVRRTGRQIVWEKAGQVAAPPPLPATDQLHCYWLSMEDLLRADERDEVLLAELRRALSGGYDIGSIQSESRFSIGPRHGRNQANQFNEAQRRRREIERGYEALRAEEAGIPSLESELRDAEGAQKRCERIEKALLLLEARRERLDAEAGLETFPDNMKSIRGDEFERLCGLEKKRTELQRELEVQAGGREAATKKLEQTGLAGGRPSEEELDLRARDLEQARLARERMESERRVRDESSVDEQEALKSLGSEHRQPRFAPESLSEAEALASRLQSLERQRDDLRSRVESTEESPPPLELERHREAAEALRSWLQIAAGAPSRSRAGAGIAAGFALAATVAASLVSAWVAAALALAAAAATAWLLVRQGSDRTGEIRERFERTTLKPPEGWTRAAVETRLNEVEEILAVLRDRQARAREAKVWRERLSKLEKDLAAEEKEKEALAGRLGFDPAITAAGIDRAARLVQHYEEARKKRIVAEKEIARLDGEMRERLDRVSGFLENWSGKVLEETGDRGNGYRIDCLTTHLDRLRKRWREAEEAEREAAGAETGRKETEKRIAELKAEEEALFQRAGIPPGKRDALARCCEKFESWKKQNQKVEAAKTLEAERRNPIAGNEDLLRLVEAGGEAELKQELEQVRSKAGRVGERRTQLANLQARIERAGADRRLEEALVAEEEAFGALEELYDQAMFSEAAQFLLRNVREKYQSEHEPEVLQDARDRFSSFTHEAFELRLDSDRGFTAFDRKQGESRSVWELSSGTRMQLLLAVRLAWTRSVERGRAPLPLFLDEALTTSDESRFSQVVESLEQTVRDEGRQVFYLSARRHEIDLWERAAGHRPHVIDLSEVRFTRTDAVPEDFSLVEPEPLPAPGGRSAAEYAALLGVPAIAPREPAGSIHIFHILRDNLSLLHRLLQNWRIDSVGQLEGLLGKGAGAHAIPESALRQRVTGRCSAARAWVRAWRKGRGQPVDRTALEQSGAVSETFIEKVSALADSLNGDGAELIEALRANQVPRFRSRNADQLEEWLREEGYIDTGESLDAEARERTVLMEVAGRGEPGDIQAVIHWIEAGADVEENAGVAGRLVENGEGEASARDVSRSF